MIDGVRNDKYGHFRSVDFEFCRKQISLFQLGDTSTASLTRIVDAIDIIHNLFYVFGFLAFVVALSAKWRMSL